MSDERPIAPETRDLIYQDLRRFRLPPGSRGRSALVVQLWWIVQALLVHPTPQIMYGWRRLVLRLFGARIGKGVLIRASAEITYPWKVEIGDHAWIGDHVTLYSIGRITIGRSAVVSQHTYVCAATHDYKDIAFPLREGPIVIGDEAWIAAHCFLAPGVTVGRAAVAGARAVVVEDVPAAAIVVGHPAKVIGMRRPGATPGEP